MSEQRFSQRDQFAFWEAYDRKCSACDNPVRFPPEIDHIVPESLAQNPIDLETIRGALNLPADFDLQGDLNLRPTCSPCNSKKGFRLPNPALLSLPLLIASQKVDRITKLREKYGRELKSDKLKAAVAAALEEGLLTGTDIRIVRPARVLDFDVVIRAIQNGGDDRIPSVLEKEVAACLGSASQHLLDWPRLTDGKWMERPEGRQLITNIEAATSSLVALLGPPGCGKSALLAHIANVVSAQQFYCLALKADHIPIGVSSLADLDDFLQTPVSLVVALQQMAKYRPVVFLLDQVDALSELMDLHSSRLSVVLSLVRKLRASNGVHIILSCREFEFQHDLRLSTLEPLAVHMEDPSWEEVAKLLGSAGIDSTHWQDHTRNILRRPQHLNFFVTHFKLVPSQPVFDSYNAMIEAVINRDFGESDARSLATMERMAAAMAQDEDLWIARARFSHDEGPALARLEGLDLIVFDANRSRVAFRHQTIFDFLRSRIFASRQIRLSEYVLSRQDALFVRPSLWSALHYLRQVDRSAYETEFQTLWLTPQLRMHIRLLLVEYLGQLCEPNVVEAGWFLPLLDDPRTAPKALQAMRRSAGWFTRIRSRLARIMTSSEQDAWRFTSVLNSALEVTQAEALLAITTHWLPNRRWDPWILATFIRFDDWNDRTTRLIEAIVRRSPQLNSHSVDHVAAAISIKLPDSAVRIVAARLWAELEETEASPPDPVPKPPPEASEADRIEHEMVHSEEEFKGVRNIVSDARSRYDLDRIASASPGYFAEQILPWVAHVSQKYARDGHTDSRRYKYDRVFDLPLSERHYRHNFTRSLVKAVESFAVADPDAFLKVVKTLSDCDSMVVHQLLAQGLALIAGIRAAHVFAYLSADDRRLGLGSCYGDKDSRRVIGALVPHLSASDALQLEKFILGYTPYLPDSSLDVELRRCRYRWNREHRVHLLTAFPAHSLSETSERLLEKERRSLPGILSDEEMKISGGFVQSPMSVEQMRAAADDDIVNLFERVTDDRESRRFGSLIGGSWEASRAFGEFAKVEPARTQRILARFGPARQERPAGEAIRGLADGNSLAPREIVSLIVWLDSRGFGSADFRQQVSWVLGNLAAVIGGLDDSVCALVEGWLIDSNSKGATNSDEPPAKARSFLSEQQRTRTLPQGNYPLLNALFAGFCARSPLAVDDWLAVLQRHLLFRTESIEVWSALLYHQMFWLRHSDRNGAQTFVERLFEKHPQLLRTASGARFIGGNHMWLTDAFLYSCLREWEISDWNEGPLAAGEVCMYRYALVAEDSHCATMIERILSEPRITDLKVSSMRLGVAFAVAELWNHIDTRDRAHPVLIRLMPLADEPIAEAIADIFRRSEILTVDSATREFMDALLAFPIVLERATGGFLVDRLKEMIADGNEPKRIFHLASAIARKSPMAGEFHSRLSHAADGLVEIALTLQRLPEARSSGVELFEDLMDADVYSAPVALSKLDRRMPTL